MDKLSSGCFASTSHWCDYFQFLSNAKCCTRYPHGNQTHHFHSCESVSISISFLPINNLQTSHHTGATLAERFIQTVRLMKVLRFPMANHKINIKMTKFLALQCEGAGSIVSRTAMIVKIGNATSDMARVCRASFNQHLILIILMKTVC